MMLINGYPIPMDASALKQIHGQLHYLNTQLEAIELQVRDLNNQFSGFVNTICAIERRLLLLERVLIDTESGAESGEDLN